MQRLHILLILLTLSISSFQSFSAPVVNLCMDAACKQPVKIKITDATWSNIKDFYQSPVSTDKDEQDNIVNSIALMELDVYQTLASINQNTDDAQTLYNNSETDTKYKNIKKYIGILLDHHLVTRHFLRKTIHIPSKWYITKDKALLLQSLTNSELYLLQITDFDLGEPTAIIPYKNSKTSITSIFSQQSSDQVDKDIE